MAVLLPLLKATFSNGDGPLVGGMLYSYAAGTSTPLATFTDESEVTPNTNPVILDANGSADVWISDSRIYKFVLQDADGNVIFTQDHVRASSGSEGSVPSGGTTGQSLFKASDADFDLEWQDPSSVPDGGTTGQALTKNSDTDGDAGWSTIDKTFVGLGNVDNTSDANKPVSTATSTALSGKEPTISSGTTSQYLRGDKSWQTLDKTAVGLSNVDNTSDATKNAATATLSNKTITSPVINTPTTDVETVTTQGSTPATPSSGTVKRYVKNDGFEYLLNSSGVETKIGTGAGGGAKNYLSIYTASFGSGTPNLGNGDAESGTTTGWSLGTIGTLTNGLPTGSPTFGSGASVNLSLTATNSLNIAGKYSFEYSSAATVAGNMMASDAFYIDAEDQAKVLSFKLAFSPQSGSSNCNWSGTSSNSFALAVYDVTNSSWIPVTGAFGMTQGSGVGICSGTFQTNSNTTQLRFVLYNANATAGAATLIIDDIQVSPQNPNVLTKAIASAFNGGGSAVSVTANAAIPYASILYDNAGTLSGLNRFTAPVSGIYNVFINGCARATSTGNSIQIWKSGSFYQPVFDFGVGGVNYSGAGQVPCNAGDYIDIRCTGSISIFPGNVIFSLANPTAGAADSDTRVVSFSANKVATQSVTANTTNITFPTVIKDTHGAWNGTDTYKVQVSGDYVIAVPGISDNAGSTTVGIQAYVNATSNQRVAMSISGGASSGSILLPGLKAGDLITVRSTATLTLSAAGSFQIFRLSGPSVIAASESVNASYASTAGQAISNTSPILIAGTKLYDSHGWYNSTTGTFTLPMPGEYLFESFITTASFARTAGTDVALVLYVNGSVYKAMGANRAQAAYTNVVEVNGPASYKGVTGDLVTVRVYSDASTTLNTGSGLVWISARRTGN